MWDSNICIFCITSFLEKILKAVSSFGGGGLKSKNNEMGEQLEEFILLSWTCISVNVKALAFLWIILPLHQRTLSLILISVLYNSFGKTLLIGHSFSSVYCFSPKFCSHIDSLYCVAWLRQLMLLPFSAYPCPAQNPRTHFDPLAFSYCKYQYPSALSNNWSVKRGLWWWGSRFRTMFYCRAMVFSTVFYRSHGSNFEEPWKWKYGLYGCCTMTF